MNILDPSEFNIVTHNEILQNTKLPIDQNILEPDYIFDLPTEYGGTLDSNKIAKSKD